MQPTPREFDKLLVYVLADVALKRRAKGFELNYPEAVAVISAVALDGERRAEMDKLKWAFAICAVLAILGLAVVPMTGQQDRNNIIDPCMVKTCL